MDPTLQYKILCDCLLEDPAITLAPTSTHRSALAKNGKIFAMLVDDQLVLRLPDPLMQELEQLGLTQPYMPDGTRSTGWCVVVGTWIDVWLTLAREASEAVV